MWLNQFSVSIPEANEENSGYVPLQHGTVYTLVLGNQRRVRCDAHVEIDGKSVGRWRLYAGESLRLERPAHDTGRFTFYRVSSAEAQQVGLQAGEPTLGLVKVVFTPEIAQRPLVSPEYTLRICNHVSGSRSRMGDSAIVVNDSYHPGGTGLSGLSAQYFVSVGEMPLDHSQQTTIHLRLVAQDDVAVTPRPLTAFSTPVPPSVGV